jgi:hypothetical protein
MSAVTLSAAASVVLVAAVLLSPGSDPAQASPPTTLVVVARPVADDTASGTGTGTGDDSGSTADSTTQPDHYGEDFWTYVQRVRPEVSRPETAVVTYLGTVGLAPALAGCLNLWGFDSARVLGHGGIAWNSVQPDESVAFDRALFACRVQHPFREDIG